VGRQRPPHQRAARRHHQQPCAPRGTQERWLNGFRHFLADIDGVRVHFVHERARSGCGIPLILTHGWPSCFAEFLPVVPQLPDPAAHGIDGPGFDVVIPSLPGYGFSGRPARTGVTCRYTAGLWHRLMRVLGYQRYGAQGGDFGSAVTTFMALDDPAPMLGIHRSNLDVTPCTGPGSRPLSAAERAYLAQHQRWREEDRGYGAIQSTRPQTVSYGLNDSPAGLAAWVLEKWRAWADSGGNLGATFSRDFLLTVVTLCWATQTIASSLRDYAGNRWLAAELGPRAGRAPLQRPPVDAHAQWWPLPIRRGTGPAQPRHRRVLQQPGHPSR
jgi:pimeloyl-ACP methyl ester carboxylesterase